ncbi:MAG: hypothetical protein E6J65_28955, partial [Deltaproteobacteria bacterium]
MSSGPGQHRARRLLLGVAASRKAPCFTPWSAKTSRCSSRRCASAVSRGWACRALWRRSSSATSSVACSPTASPASAARVPVRQWVLSLPRWARWILARDAQLASRALAVALRAIFAHYRRRARATGEEAGRCGAVTFVQRFGGALNLNVHFHCIVPDGVFVREGGALRFATLRPPTDEEVQAVLLRIARRLDRLLRPHRPGPDTELSSLDLRYAESLQASLPVGLAEPPRRKRQSALIDGFSLHAGVHLHANDREGLEKFCGYGAR